MLSVRGPKSILLRLRLAQVRFLAKVLSAFDRLSLGRLLHSLVPNSLLQFALGYRWTFPSIAEAQRVAARFLPRGHDHPDNAQLHLQLSQAARPSDYPVLFHLARAMGPDCSVFDLGGNVGNLYYNYSHYVGFPPTLRWTVCDIPEMCALGSQIARLRHVSGLRFSENAAALAGCDVLLASGSLHYFDLSLPEMLTAARALPRHVLVNRTPVLPDRTVVTVQDVGSFLVACKVHARNTIVDGMVALGYELVDQWSVPELSLRVPCHPRLSVPSYSGFYFRLRRVAPVAQASHDYQRHGEPLAHLPG